MYGCVQCRHAMLLLCPQQRIELCEQCCNRPAIKRPNAAPACLLNDTCSLLVQELVCSRLYVAVRDRLNLTYDVSFTIEQHDRLNASWWYVNVTASPDLVAQATQACVKARHLMHLANCLAVADLLTCALAWLRICCEVGDTFTAPRYCCKCK